MTKYGPATDHNQRRGDEDEQERYGGFVPASTHKTTCETSGAHCADGESSQQIEGTVASQPCGDQANDDESNCHYQQDAFLPDVHVCLLETMLWMEAYADLLTCVRVGTRQLRSLQ